MKHGLEKKSFALQEILLTGWREFSDNFPSILVIFLLAYAPINIGLYFIPLEEILDGYTLADFDAFLIIFTLCEFLFGLLAATALACLIESSVKGEPVTWRKAIRSALARWPSSVGTAILGGAIVFCLSLLLIIPGVVWSVYYLFAVYAVALRGRGGKNALDYSKWMVLGQWWRVLGYFVVIGLLGLCADKALGAFSALLPENRIILILLNALFDLASALFLCMSIVFFLNVDYIKRRLGQRRDEPARAPAPIAIPAATGPDGAVTAASFEAQEQ